MSDKKYREELAEYAHEAWSGWMKHIFSKCDKFDDGYVIPNWAWQRWDRQMRTVYAELPEEEKESDRKEADKMLAITGYKNLKDAADELAKLLIEYANSTKPTGIEMWGKIYDAAESYRKLFKAGSAE